AECGGRVAHEVRFEVYDVVLKSLELSLSVLGDLHVPGEEVSATFCALDQNRKPVEGARVKFRATFGALEVLGAAGPTDLEGRAVIRFVVPATAERGGHLSAGIDVK